MKSYHLVSFETGRIGKKFIAKDWDDANDIADKNGFNLDDNYIAESGKGQEVLNERQVERSLFSDELI